MNETHRLCSSFIVHRSSFIVHPSSFIVHPSSFIVHPSSFYIIRSLYAGRPDQGASPAHRRKGGRQWLAVQQAQLGEAAVSDHPRWERVPAMRRLQERGQRRDVEGGGRGDAGV